MNLLVKLAVMKWGVYVGAKVSRSKFHKNELDTSTDRAFMPHRMVKTDISQLHCISVNLDG